jgi:hypothetical protein
MAFAASVTSPPRSFIRRTTVRREMPIGILVDEKIDGGNRFVGDKILIFQRSLDRGFWSRKSERLYRSMGID